MFSLLFKFTLMPTLFPMMLSYVSKLSSIFCARAPGEDAGALALPLMLGVPPGISFFFSILRHANAGPNRSDAEESERREERWICAKKWEDSSSGKRERAVSAPLSVMNFVKSLIGSDVRRGSRLVR